MLYHGFYVNDEVDACAEKLYGIIRQRAGLDR